MRSILVACSSARGPTAGLAAGVIQGRGSQGAAAGRRLPPRFASCSTRQGFGFRTTRARRSPTSGCARRFPAREKPAGPKGAILFPFLADGELIGVLQFAAEGHDYRDQPIAKGVYTMRYGLQPVNGDHLGVSTFRDYSLLLPAAKDQTLALAAPQAARGAKRRIGRNEPSRRLLVLAAPPEAAKSAPSMIRDAEKNTWSVVLPLASPGQGQSEPIVLSGSSRRCRERPRRELGSIDRAAVRSRAR